MLEGVSLQTFEDKGSSLIKRYKGFGEEGYGFIYVTNGDKEATYIEKV